MLDRDLERDIVAIAGGDADALRNLYTVYRNAIYGLSISILHDHHAAEDVSQEVLLKIWAYARTYRVGQNPKAWILKITKNEAIDALQKNKYEYSIDDESFAEIADVNSLDEEIINSMEMAEILKKLPDDISEIITLHAIGGLTFREIGKSLGLTLPTVFRKYNTGISELQKWVFDNEGEII